MRKVSSAVRSEGEIQGSLRRVASGRRIPSLSIKVWIVDMVYSQKKKSNQKQLGKQMAAAQKAIV